MGVYDCERHGLGPAIYHCKRVRDAIDRRESEPAEVIIDGWHNPNLLCQSCARQARELLILKPRGRADIDGFEPAVFDFEGDPSVDCLVCINEWLHSFGKDEFSVLLARASTADQ